MWLSDFVMETGFGGCPLTSTPPSREWRPGTTCCGIEWKAMSLKSAKWIRRGAPEYFWWKSAIKSRARTMSQASQELCSTPNLLGDRFPSLSASTVSLVYLDCYLYPTQFIFTAHYFLHLHIAHTRCPHPSLVAVAAPRSSWTFTQVLLDYSVSHVPP